MNASSSARVALLVLASSFLTTSAFAQDGVKRAKSGKKPAAPAPVLVASAEPLPPLPAPELPPAAPTAPAPAADAAAKPEATNEPTAAGPGLVLSVGGGIGGTGGEVLTGVGVGAVVTTVDARIGGYITPHFGLIGGLQVGTGMITAGCESCTAVVYQLPVVAQYALIDRSRGLYLEGGIAAVNTLMGSSKEGSAAFEASSPVDLKFGLGYRFLSGPKDKPSNTGVDLRFNFDIGSYKSVSTATIDSDIPSSLQATHFSMGLALGYAFRP